MTDTAFLVALRAIAGRVAEGFARAAANAADRGQHDASDVADLAATVFGELADLAGNRLATERARLVAAVEESALRHESVALDHSEWTLIHQHADDDVTEATAALAAFDAAAGGA